MLSTAVVPPVASEVRAVLASPAVPVSVIVGSRAARAAATSALADVEVALAGTSRLGQQEQLQADVQTRAQESLRLAEIRYRAGADDLLTVLDAQRTLFAAQDQLAQVELSRLQAAVSLYKALGGGWNAAQSAVRA